MTGKDGYFCEASSMTWHAHCWEANVAIKKRPLHFPGIFVKEDGMLSDFGLELPSTGPITCQGQPMRICLISKLASLQVSTRDNPKTRLLEVNDDDSLLLFGSRGCEGAEGANGTEGASGCTSGVWRPRSNVFLSLRTGSVKRSPLSDCAPGLETITVKLDAQLEEPEVGHPEVKSGVAPRADIHEGFLTPVLVVHEADISRTP